MISAVVLVNTNVGQENKVLENLKAISGVEEAHTLWGIYDLLVKIKASSIDRLKEIIKTKLMKLAGVCNVLTLMILDAPKGP